MGIIIVVVVLAAGAAGAAKLAREQGRSQLAWIFVAIAAGACTLGLHALLMAQVLRWRSALSGFGVVLGGPMLLVGGQLAVLGVLYSMRGRVPMLHKKSWPAYRVAVGGTAGYACEIALEPTDVVIAPDAAGSSVAVQRIPYASIAQACVDGECLRLTTSGQEHLLQPGGPDYSALARNRLSTALAQIIEQRARRDRQPDRR